MKNKIILMLAAISLIAASCSKENDNSLIPGTTEEKGFVQLSVSSKFPATRGSVGQETATAAELKIDGTKGLKVYVFNQDGTLDYSGHLTLTEQGTTGSNSFKSEPFEVTAGDKYFLVFANDPALGGKIIAPAAGMKLDAFMAQAVTTVYDAAGKPDIAVDNSFLLGSMWKKSDLAAAGGTTAVPVPVSLTVGRLSSKVTLAEIDYTTDGMDGTFSNGTYRIGSMPYKINTMGITEGATSPVGVNDILVLSHAHNAAPYVVVGGAPPMIGFNAADYCQYADFKAVGASFYATENTSARDAITGALYYGNSTYIQVETTYTPAASEIYDPSDLSAGATLAADGTFYMGYLNDGTRLLFNREPVAGDHIDIDLATIVMYAQGLNYHKFAIYDKNESDDVNRFRVLRNHYYEYRITNFKELGSYTSEVDPTEPIPTTTTIDIEVEVLHWDKVSDDVEV